MIITQETCDIVNKAKTEGRRICAVGISTMRATESAVGTDCMLKEFNGWTNKFIFPPYDFSVADSMVSNFQLPESIQLMLTCAYGGYEKIMAAYNLAVKEGYRFGCYGDAMLITD
jgi:S-adenosylmethionine:tRNA ribosyltransferase-isomerase